MDSRDRPLWVFRRIGPSPSIPECVEVAELKEGFTSFGRGATADVYIDSLVLRNFISRRHAVVEGKRDQDGCLSFILHNHGLNGTYVNDVRIGEVHQLQEGDKVTFGHKNGYKVKVGETALQPESEFQFVLERCQSAQLGLHPLQERIHRVDTKDGRTGVPGMHQSRTSRGAQDRNVEAISTNCSQQPSVTAKRKRASNQQVISDDLPELSPKASSERLPKTFEICDSETNPRSFTGKGSSKERGVCATKENKRTYSNTRRQESGERTNHRRHSDDGIPKSFWEKSKNESLTLLPQSMDDTYSPKRSKRSSTSSSPRRFASKSPKPRDRCCSSGVDSATVHRNQSRSSKHKTRSRKSSVDNHERKYVSSVRDASAERLLSSRYVSSDTGSVSPKSSHCDSRLQNGKSVKDSWPSPGPAPSEKESELPRKLSTRSRSPRPDNLGSSSEYDEPPVLTPEYVQSPSSELRTPSPHDFMDKDEENFDEVDDIDRDSVFCGIPPTPGRSFLDLSPDSHSNRHGTSPQYIKDISPHRKGEEVSSSGTNSDAGFTQKDRSSKDHAVSASSQGKYFEKEKRHASEKRSEHCQRRESRSSSKPQSRHVEPDSTTTFRDKTGCDSDSDGNRKRHITSEKEYPMKQRSNEKEFLDYKSCQVLKRGHNGDHVKSPPDASHQKHMKPQVKEKRTECVLPAKAGDRNVFDKFSADVYRSDQCLKRKRHHNEEAEVCVGDSAKLSPRASKLPRNCVEKENGLTPSKESSTKERGQDGRNREKHLTDGHTLKDVKVSIQRVSSHDRRVSSTPTDTGSSNNHQRWPREVKTEKSRESTNKEEQQRSSMTTRNKSDRKEVCERKDLSDTSLFGIEMERLGMMRLKERTRTPREKNHSEDSKGRKPGPTSTRNSKEQSKQHEKSAASVTHGLKSSAASEKSKERRSQRIVKSRSQTPDRYWSDSETEKPKPVRKVATRRPRQRDADDIGVSQKVAEQGEPRAGRPGRKRKRRRKKKDDSDEDDEEDESLEEGVTWYEEDTCASAHCHRPADRRVQWVCCDDCDSWYHTVCVGIFLEDLKEDEDYHCGCV